MHRGDKLKLRRKLRLQRRARDMDASRFERLGLLVQGAGLGDVTMQHGPQITGGGTVRGPSIASARALGAAREGDVAAAEKDATQIAVLHYALADAKNTYWGTEVEVQKLAANAWIVLARKDSTEAVRLMRAAEAAGDRANARRYYERLLAMAKIADGMREELATAKAFSGAK